MNPAGATALFADLQADLRLFPERAADRETVDDLIDSAFGPGRFAKTAERLREGNRLRSDLSFCTWLGGEMVAAVRQWPILIGPTPALFLGPIATRPERRGQGFGRTLVRRVCEAAQDRGERIVLLVGDRAYFEPIGFTPVEPGRVTLPGPVDPARLLWSALAADALDGVAGLASVPPRA